MRRPRGRWRQRIGRGRRGRGRRSRRHPLRWPAVPVRRPWPGRARRGRGRAAECRWPTSVGRPDRADRRCERRSPIGAGEWIQGKQGGRDGVTVAGLGDHAADLSGGGGSVTGAADRHRRQGGCLRPAGYKWASQPAPNASAMLAASVAGRRLHRGNRPDQAVGVQRAGRGNHQHIATAAGILDRAEARRWTSATIRGRARRYDAEETRPGAASTR